MVVVEVRAGVVEEVVVVTVAAVEEADADATITDQPPTAEYVIW